MCIRDRNTLEELGKRHVEPVRDFREVLQGDVALPDLDGGQIGAVHADFVGEPLLADIVDGAQILDAQTDFYLKYVSHRRSVSWMLCI